MTLTQLRTFLTVVELGSVRAAADRLLVSQPAVSAAVSSLGRELGVDLVAPDGRGIRVTAAGAAFAESARSGLARLDHGVRVARSVEEPGRGQVRIAAIATAAEQVLLPLLGEFRQQYPEAAVSVEVGNRATVWDALAGLGVDLVVAGRPPGSVDARILGRAANTLVVVGGPGEPADGRARREVLAATTWLLREEGSGTREATEELLTDLDIEPPRMILGSNGAVREAVIAGFGIGLLPLAAVEGSLSSGLLDRIACPGTPIERPWHLVAPGGVTLSPTAELAARSLCRPGGFGPASGPGPSPG